MSTSPTQIELSEADTRSRLIEAAGQVFADKGFHHATVREICQAAGANIAAVNYHFGDKERLYREVIHEFARVAIEKYPIGGATESTPDERLRAFIRNYLNRLLDEGRPAWHGKLIAREMVEPSGVLDELYLSFVKPQYERLRAIVIELLVAEGETDQVRLCCASIVSQCLFYKNCRPMIQKVMPQQTYDEAGRRQLAEHISQFCLSALKAVRAANRSEAGGGTA